MSTFEWTRGRLTAARRTRRLIALAALLAGSLFECSEASTTTCLRFSDCADGLTCAAGMCVIPAGAVDAGVFDSGATTQVTPPTDAGGTSTSTTTGDATDTTASTGTDDSGSTTTGTLTTDESDASPE